MKMCFQLHGRYLTKICREFVLEGRWRHSLNTLSSLEGITLETCISILQGNEYLDGVNSYELKIEDEDIKFEYQQNLASAFSGLYSLDGKVYEPYAYISSFGRCDIPSGAPSIYSSTFATWSDSRRDFYKDHPSDLATEDHQDLVDYPGTVLWRLVEDYPFWITPIKDVKLALLSYLKSGKRLEERGARFFEEEDNSVLKIDREDKVEINTKEYCTVNTILDQKDYVLYPAIVAPGYDTGDPFKHMKDIEPDREFIGRSGYVLPDGLFYSCNYMHHKYLAAKLLSLSKIEFKDPEIKADELGWLRIQESKIIPGQVSFSSTKDRLTKSQSRTLADWCIAHQEQFPDEWR